MRTEMARTDADAPLEQARRALRDRGMRWTPQRRALIQAVLQSQGHVTTPELLARVRQSDPEVIPSTVYRTLDVLEEIGLVSHSHRSDGREEFHVLPSTSHGHLECEDCGRSWEINPAEARQVSRVFEQRRGFGVDVSHLTVAGRCAECAATAEPPAAG